MNRMIDDGTLHKVTGSDKRYHEQDDRENGVTKGIMNRETAKWF